mmetsp:Transcript_38863/g.116843  ORF Transcript_38863/g.116843 Transcript_38863/m.116843 type:complete len:87 (+) Transcript_38863:433-693(+)
MGMVPDLTWLLSSRNPVDVSERGSYTTVKPTAKWSRRWGVVMVPNLPVVKVPRERQRAASTMGAPPKKTSVVRNSEATSVASITSC